MEEMSVCVCVCVCVCCTYCSCFCSHTVTVHVLDMVWLCVCGLLKIHWDPQAQLSGVCVFVTSKMLVLK